LSNQTQASAPPDSTGPAHHDAHISPNVRLGLVLFFIYLALYLGFMAITTFKYELLARTPFGGVNLAILYGMGLIVAALILAAIYMGMAKKDI
jgi:uncharacterized membrane protein (DUF485 family)